jgi:hypothetical protein
MKTTKRNLLYGLIGIVSIVIILLWFRHIEPFDNNVKNKCPTHLIKDGNKILLYDPTLAKVPGVNPIQFNSLEDYSKYVKWQRANNLHCPVLQIDKALQNSSDTDIYSIHSSTSSKTSFDTGNGNGTSVLNHDLPSISDGMDHGVPRIQNQNYTLDYYTSDLKDLIELPGVRVPLQSTPTKSSSDESKLKPCSVSEAFSMDLINSSDLTSLSSEIRN